MTRSPRRCIRPGVARQSRIHPALLNRPAIHRRSSPRPVIEPRRRRPAPASAECAWLRGDGRNLAPVRHHRYSLEVQPKSEFCWRCLGSGPTWLRFWTTMRAGCATCLPKKGNFRRLRPTRLEHEGFSARLPAPCGRQGHKAVACRSAGDLGLTRSDGRKSTRNPGDSDRYRLRIVSWRCRRVGF